MPAQRLSMRKVREVLRLSSTGRLSHRQIAEGAGVARSTVKDYLARLRAAGLAWPLPEDLDDAALEARLFVTPGQQRRDRPLPEWPVIHRELQRKGVTLLLLWQEYKTTEPLGVNYSRFCELYKVWRSSLDVVMRQSHAAGERLFVDYVGMTIGITDPLTGEVHQAQVFCAAFGASNYSYAEATATQTLPDWIGAHQRAFAFFGGVPEIVVPDNLKSGVTNPHRYDPDLNRSYTEMAEHYGVAIMPARSRAPRDKAKVESAVQVVERWILAALRDRTFFSLQEANRAIALRIEELNSKAFQKLDGSRRSLFKAVDQPALRPLPTHRYEYAEWQKVRVGLDYHVTVDSHSYSVPYRHARQQLHVRISAETVECFQKGQRIAVHRRSHQRDGATTLREHMPESHRQYAEHTPEMILAWAARVGSATEELARTIIRDRAHPAVGYRACLGVLRLGKAYGEDRLEAAAVRALAIGTTRYESIASILKQGLDRRRPAERGSALSDEAPAAIGHENIRGAHYYSLSAEEQDSAPSDTPVASALCVDIVLSSDPPIYTRDYPC